MQEIDLVPAISQVSLITPDQTTLRNILLATDFSEYSTRALSYALGIASRYKSQLYLFHCVDPAPYNLVEPGAVQTACDDARRELEQLALDLRYEGKADNIEIKVVVETGDFGAILAGVIKDLNLGLIVVGTHGRTGWRKAILGSVAEIVMDQASCPVLSVGPSADRTRTQEFGPENILLAIKACGPSQLAESYAFSLASKYGARLTVVDVLQNQSGRVLAKVSQLEWSEPERKNSILKEGSTKPEQLPSKIGTESDVILQVADQSAADLIVLAMPAGHKIASRFVSTSSYQVLCGAPCPVLSLHSLLGREQ